MSPTKPCSLCQGKKFSKIGDFLARQIVRCQKCGLVQVNPLPSEKEVGDLYSGDYFKNYNQYLANLPTHQAYFKKKLLQIEKKVKKGKLLDIGCALGVFLDLAKKRGWAVTGLEIFKEAASYCQKRGLEVILGTIEKVNFAPNSFDLVTCFETIEHMREPKEMVKEVFKILKKEGLAVFSTPNYDTWTRKLMGKFWFGYKHREHLFFFTPKTLKLLFEKGGFSQIEVMIDDLRPFPLHYFFSRLAFYLPFWPLKPILNFLSRTIKAWRIDFNIPTDPWGDMIAYARK